MLKSLSRCRQLAAVSPLVRIVDPSADVARGIALDICQSGAVTGTSIVQFSKRFQSRFGKAPSTSYVTVPFW